MNFAASLDFKPKLVSTLKNYSFDKFKNDLVAGIVVGIVALPLAIAFGIASGVSPTVGLITAIIGGFIVSAAGGCTVQIGGPTGAFIVIVYNIIANFGLEGLAVATLMAGLILVALGIFRLGTVIKFIPYPIVVGFTAGIALTIFSTQINDFFGLGLKNVPSEFIPKWGMYLSNFGNVDWITLGVGLAALAIIIVTPKISRRLPGALIAIIVVTLVVSLVPGLHVETIGDRFGSLSTDIPEPHGFELSMATINRLLPSAFTIAILGAIESLLSATVADGVTGTRTNSNTELIGQGMANIIVPFFGGIPVTGAIARTMTNITNGGRTPVAGLVHAIVLFLIFLFLMPLINLIPMACLAAVLIVVSYNMSGWRTIRAIFHNPKSDISVLVLTFLLTVIFDLTIAIEMGLLLAVILFLRRVMENTEIKVYSEQLDIAEGSETTHHEMLNVNPGVEVYEIDGPFFFGVATKFDELMRTTIGEKPKVRIIRMRKVPFIDSTGIHNLEVLIKSSYDENIQVVLSGVRENVRAALVNAGVNTLLGDDHICDHITKAVEMANRLAPASATAAATV
ncbi:sulfate permease [Muribaculaceae bacterium Isolate-039 (Harlan)]|jgi:SulP family sulfate permease|uniref:SulP family inorganic anion transporter n=1 Tax=Duncaniella muris TaxID=2094150 RepID=UPI000F48FBF4|nr:sulfate permease [Duncaniella muris]ROS91554.1 sulfate permease [Muribaculaceae bacterium Isolate-039 (Harlan)]ROT00038.1 sulfate permease [Muribaculaceae bacterium Isolate-077 (Janvier)]ROT00778.1 sulfate permease [Muribaculaceae bacterium Isolate-083 (Janvier)]ROT02534.1 sulfate permease [Muribaculaceae bacterium Isolate-084 (Janvier)]